MIDRIIRALEERTTWPDPNELGWLTFPRLAAFTPARSGLVQLCDDRLSLLRIDGPLFIQARDEASRLLGPAVLGLGEYRPDRLSLW